MSSEIKKALHEARSSYKENKYADVIKKCKKILKTDKNCYNALVLLAAAMKHIEEFKIQVPLVLEKATKIEPDTLLAWQGLVMYYENNFDNSGNCDRLMLAYCKLLQLDSNSDFSTVLNKILELSRQCKDNNIVVQCIQSLRELQSKLDGEKLILVEKTLLQILIANSNNLNEYLDLLESIFTRAINNVEVDSRHDYFKKYLYILYDSGRLTTLMKQAISMHYQFPHDDLPLEYICRICYEQNISNDSITQFYESLTRLNFGSDIVEVVQVTRLNETDNLIAVRQILKSILLLKPQLFYGWLILSNINMRLYCWEDVEIAMKQALKFVKHKPDDELSHKLKLTLIESMSKSNSKKKWETALQLCEDHLRIHPSIKLELVRTRLRILLDDPDVCIDLNNLELQSETKDQARILKMLYLKQHRKLEEATNIFDSSIETSEAWSLLGVIYWEMAKYNESLIAFLNGIKADRYNWECLIYLGHYYREYGNDLERSRKCYQAALQINPNSEEAGTGLSTAYRLLKDQDANIQLLQKLTVKDSGPKWAWAQLGLQYLDQGDALQAIKAFQRVIRADPNNNHNWESLADAYFMRGAYASALKSYQRALELYPKSIYSMIQLANIKLILGHYNNAKEEFKRILLNEPRYVPALKGLAETCVALAKKNTSKHFLGHANDNLQEAMDSLTLIIRERKDISCVWKLLGDVCYTVALMPEKYSLLKVPSILVKGDDTESTISLKQRDMFLLSTRCYCSALSLSPQSSFLWHDLACCYLMQLHFDDQLTDHKTLASKCLAAGKHAVKLCPSSWMHWNLLGVICMSPYINNYALAQHAFIMAIDRELNNAAVWSNLGTLYLCTGYKMKANEAYGKAQRADPAYMNSWIGQAFLAEEICQKEALDLFRHSTQLGYHDQAALGYAHYVLTVLLNYDAEKDSSYTYIIENMHATYVASDVMNWYIARHPNDRHARNAYGLLLERQNLRRSAAEQFATALSIKSKIETDSVSINLARVLTQLGKPKEAVKLCRSVGKANYNSQCHLALSLFKAEQYEESYNTYEEILQKYADIGIETAYIFCAMATIAYIFQGAHDAKTLLLQCISASVSTKQSVAITGYLSAASLGILHGDLNLAELVLNELEPFQNHGTYGPHVANLSAYLHLVENNIKKAVTTLSKAIFMHPNDARYWIQLLRIVSAIDMDVFNKCAQKTLFLSRNTHSTDLVHSAYASLFKYFVQTSVADSKNKFIQKLLFAYPGNIECSAEYIAALLPRLREVDSKH